MNIFSSALLVFFSLMIFETLNRHVDSSLEVSMSEMQFEFSTFTPIYKLQMIDRDSLDKLMLADIIEYCQERGIYNKYQSLLKSAKVPPP